MATCWDMCRAHVIVPFGSGTLPYLPKFASHLNQTSGWLPPADSWDSSSLPFGWETAIDKEGRTYYVNHLNKTTTYEDPRKWSQIDAEENPQPRSVELIRDRKLGFGFVAGSEKPVIVRFVTSGGPSVNKLMPGDQILQINGQDVKQAPREQVIQLVRNCREKVSLVVCQPPVDNSSTRKSAMLSAAKKAQLKSNPSRVRFAESVDINGPLGHNTNHCHMTSSDSVMPLMPNVLKVFLENGQTKSFKYDTSTTVQDVIDSLQTKLNLSCTKYFALVVEHVKSLRRNKLTILNPSELLSRIASRPGAYNLRCLFRVTYVPAEAYDLLREDSVAFEYFYMQCCNDVVQERFSPELKYEVALRLAALQMHQHVFATNGITAKVSVKSIEKECGFDRFVPASIIQTMKTKELRKLLSHFVKLNSSLISPGQKHLTALQAKLHYLKVISELPSYGAKCFSTSINDSNMEMVVLISRKFGISQISSLGNSVPVNLCDMEQVSKVLLTKEDQISQKVCIQLKDTDKEPIELTLDDRDAEELILVLSGYFRLIQQLELEVVREKTAWTEDQAPPYCSVHHVTYQGWNYPAPNDVANDDELIEREYRVDLAAHPPYHHTNPEDGLPMAASSSDSNSDADSSMTSGSTITTTDPTPPALPDKMVTMEPRPRVISSTETRDADAFGGFNSNSMSHKQREHPTNLNLNQNHVNLNKANSQIRHHLSNGSLALRHSQPRPVKLPMSPAMHPKSLKQPKGSENANEYSRQPASTTSAPAAPPTPPPPPPPSSTAKSRLIGRLKPSDSSFGLHSPDNFPGGLSMDGETHVQDLVKKLIHTNTLPNDFTEGNLVLDPDLIDLTMIPPPLTPDEEGVYRIFTSQVGSNPVRTPPTPFADRTTLEAELKALDMDLEMLKNNSVWTSMWNSNFCQTDLSLISGSVNEEQSELAAVCQLRDIESFIANVRVPPPPKSDRGATSVIKSSEDLSAFIIPPPPPSVSKRPTAPIPRETPLADREVQEVKVSKEVMSIRERDKISPKIASIQQKLALGVNGESKSGSGSSGVPPPPPPRANPPRPSRGPLPDKKPPPLSYQFGSRPDPSEFTLPIKSPLNNGVSGGKSESMSSSSSSSSSSPCSPATTNPKTAPIRGASSNESLSSSEASTVATVKSVSPVNLVVEEVELPPTLPPRRSSPSKPTTPSDDVVAKAAPPPPVRLINKSLTKVSGSHPLHRSLPKIPDQSADEEPKPSLPIKSVAVVSASRKLPLPPGPSFSRPEESAKVAKTFSSSLPGLMPVEMYSNQDFGIDAADEAQPQRSAYQAKVVVLGPSIGESRDDDPDDALRCAGRSLVFKRAEEVIRKVVHHVDSSKELCTRPDAQRRSSQPLYNQVKDQLTNDARQFVTASKLFVKSATESEDQMMECLNHCIQMLDRIGMVSRDVALHTPTPLQTQALLGKVKDVAETYLLTVQAAAQAVGRDMNHPSMNILMKRATTLASVLTTLMRSLRVFS